MTSPRFRRWFRLSLRGLFVLMTIFGIWLGVQVKWLRDRQEARRWIAEHEVSDWSSVIAPDPYWATTVRGGKRTVIRVTKANAPWSLRLLGETRLNFIFLDKGKLTEADVSRIDSLQALFPEADGVHVEEPGFCTRWRPANPSAFLKYPTHIVEGVAVNEPEPGPADNGGWPARESIDEVNSADTTRKRGYRAAPSCVHLFRSAVNDRFNLGQVPLVSSLFARCGSGH